MADPWVVRSGRWLTKRRGVILSPLFVSALFSARMASLLWVELGRDLLGLLCLAGGTWLRLLAASYHESGHQENPITAGPYAWVRHPLYLSNFLLGLGIILVAGWWPMAVGYLLVFLPLHLIIARSEEVHLIKLYGRKYEDYRRCVPAIFPWRRFAGPQHGAPNRFKLEKGKEGLKAAGYLAGMAALLLMKHWRGIAEFPPLQPMPFGAVLLASAAAGSAVILRPRLRSKWLRISQTAISTACVLLIVIHLPGVLPGPASQPRKEKMPAIVPVSVPDSPVVLRPGPLSRVGTFLWNHIDIAGGAATFGIAALVEEEREEGRGGFRPGDDLSEAGRIALGTAFVLGFWRQWRAASGWTVSPMENGSWHFQIEPVVERRGLALVAICKRRF